jgi:hypothetical protein
MTDTAGQTPNDEPRERPRPATPRWVKVTWLVVGIAVGLVLILVLAGHGHGPWQHMPGHHGLQPATSATVGDR